MTADPIWIGRFRVSGAAAAAVYGVTAFYTVRVLFSESTGAGSRDSFSVIGRGEWPLRYFCAFVLYGEITIFRLDRLRLGKTQINLVLHSACTIFVDMMEFLETYHLVGIVVGAATFLIIGVFHPFVIKGEYYFGVRCWWAFAVSGVAALAASLWVENLILSILLAVWGASSLWGIGELFEQRERVAKGWFPKREKKNRRGGR